MIDVLWPTLVAPLLVGYLLALLPDYLLKPQPGRLRRRPAAAHLVHLGLWLLLFAGELLLFQRPWFVAVNVAALLLVFVLISNAKYRVLREPFIFQDTEYVADAFRHPRLYFPFFGVRRTLLAAVAIIALYATGLGLEPAMQASYGWPALGGVVLALAILGAAALWLGNRWLAAPDLEPEKDMQALGLLASLWAYAREERRPAALVSPFTSPIHLNDANQSLPDLVVVQSESFFDPRALFAGIKPDVLARFDALKGKAVAHGPLQVPAWGANTVRSEFAFLSGLGPQQLGVHRFNPYRQVARSGLPTLASALRAMGYHTICVHPYPAGFYDRERVYPLLGFETFLDIQAFDPRQRFGPFISDLAVAEKVCELLDSDDARPRFIFVITMENHGPLHLESVSAADVADLYHSPPPKGCEELTVYLRHLRHADAMLEQIQTALSAQERHGWLGWYGDHVPAIPRVYNTLGEPTGRTEYLLWSTIHNLKTGVAASTLTPDELGYLLYSALLSDCRL